MQIQIEDLRTATAPEIDGALAELAELAARVLNHQQARVHKPLLRHLPRVESDYPYGGRRAFVAVLALVERGRAFLEAGAADASAVKVVERALTAYDETEVELAKIRAEREPLSAEFDRRGGWTRAYLVPGGHVHASMQCSTCNRVGKPTEFVWMPAYSDMDEAAIIAAAGWRACTVCWPAAPVGTPETLPSQMLTPDERERAAAAAERERKRQAADDDRIAKAPTADGSPLRVDTGHRSGEVFKTERAAVQWAVSVLAYDQLYGWEVGARNEKGVDLVVSSLAAKHGKPEAEIRADIDRRVKAKVKRDSR